MVASSTSAPSARKPATRRPRSLLAATAARSISPVEIAGTPNSAARICACVPFPEPGGPIRTSRRGRPPLSAKLPTAPLDPAPAHKSFIIPHDQLALDLLDRVHRHADDD